MKRTLSFYYRFIRSPGLLVYISIYIPNSTSVELDYNNYYIYIRNSSIIKYNSRSFLLKLGWIDNWISVLRLRASVKSIFNKL